MNTIMYIKLFETWNASIQVNSYQVIRMIGEASQYKEYDSTIGLLFKYMVYIILATVRLNTKVRKSNKMIPRYVIYFYSHK